MYSEGPTINKNVQLIIALKKIKGVGPAKISKFVKKCRYNYEECLSSAPSFFKINDSLLDLNLKEAESEIILNTSVGTEAISLLDDEFPRKLCECEKPVVLLFYKGNISLISTRTVGVIGTRNPLPTFLEKGRILVKNLSERGYTVVSGLAIGCDTLAHTAALDYGAPTIAVLPSSCDDIYPSSNKKLANEIVEKNGLLISEYGAGSIFSKYNLPERDRIQSILSELLIVIQASDEGGSMIAVRRSLEDNKPVLALKGNDLKLIKQYIEPDDDVDASGGHQNHWF